MKTQPELETYTFPRTLQEAFGKNTDSTLYGVTEEEDGQMLVLKIAIAIVVVFVLLIVLP